MLDHGLKFCLSVATAVGVMASPGLHAQSATNFPDRAINYVVTVPPGGAADFVGRVFASALSGEVKQPVVVENKVGASGTIATAYVARAKPDGYTILQAAISTHGIGPHFFKDLSYDPFKDFMSLGVIAEFPLVLAVKADLPVNSVQDLINLANKNPGQVTFASAGVGSAPHLTAEIFMAETGVKMLHVPYKGSAPAVRDLMGGQVDIMFDGLPSLSSGLKSGKLKPIAAVSTKRNGSYPNMPTFVELGYPKMVSALWYIPMVPAGTPTDIVNKLNVDFVKALKGSDYEKKLEAGGASLTYVTPSATQKYVQDDHARWGQVIKNSGVPTTK